MSKEELSEDLFELSQYLAASAEGLQNEPKDYGPLRLVEVLRRLALIMQDNYGDEFMEQVAQEVEENKDLLMTDREQFYDFLNQLVIKFAKEAKERT